jgi:choline-sulfatase
VRKSARSSLRALPLILLATAVCRGAPARVRRPNVVLITLDTTRADHLGSYGWRYARTPSLDALARKGALFLRCDTAAPLTLPSHATILTGLFPPRHGVRDNGTFVLPPRVKTIAERLQAAGYDTGAVVSAIVLAARYGLDRGFRIYDDDLGTGYTGDTEVSERPAEATTAAARAVLARLRPPYFLWVHYFDPHEEYRPPTRFADTIAGPSRLYDGEIAYVDEQLGALLRSLPADTDVAVVGDHGEMLGEHGELTHGVLLYRGARRVPLILAGPDVPAGRVVRCLVRTADVAPTILSWAGVAAPRRLDGASLLPLPDGNACDRVSYTESFLPFFDYKWYPLRALSDGRYLYLQAPRPSLYDISSDPGEKHDLTRRDPAAAKEWEVHLQALLARMGEGLQPELRPASLLSSEGSRRLLSLGYLGGNGGGLVRADLPDPRSRIALARRLHDAIREVQDGHCPEALPRLKDLVRLDPHNFPALSLAGKCLRDAGEVDAALGLFRRAQRENPLSAVPPANIAGCLLRLGRGDEAAGAYRQALSLDPAEPVAASNLARLLRGRGDRAGALRTLDRAIAAGSRAPAVLLERGLTLAESGRLADALTSFLDAARRSPANPLPLEDAARAAYKLGRYRESAQMYESLLRLSAGRGDLWKTLGAVYLFHLGDQPSAVRAFRHALRLEAAPGERRRLEELIRSLGD